MSSEVYIADAQGQIRHHQFGEGRYEECERVIQRLLREAGVENAGGALVSVAADGFEAQADWTNLASPETYLGYEQTQNFASPGGVAFDESRTFVAPDSLRLNHWALSGDWTIESGASLLNGAGGGIAFRFHDRDVHLVLRGTSVPFRVLIDGEPAGDAHGLDVDLCALGWSTTTRRRARSGGGCQGIGRQDPPDLSEPGYFVEVEAPLARLAALDLGEIVRPPTRDRWRST